MAIIVSLSFLMSGYINSKTEIAVRNVDVSEIGTLSYEERVEQFLGTLDDYTVENSSECISFEGYRDMSNFDFSSVQFLSTSAETTTKKYRTKLDAENEKFYVITEYIQDDVVVYSETIETKPYYDEYTDDYYIEMPDGTNISVSDSMSQDNLNECFATVAALTMFEVAVLLAAVVVVAAPAITQVVTVVVTTIISWVRSFLSWFRSLWAPKTVKKYSVSVSEKLSYTITVSGVKVEAIPYAKETQYKLNQYYIAVADTDDGLLYISNVPVDEIQALAILTRPTYVNSAHKGSCKSFVLSLYTVSGESARLIATDAGTLLGSPGAVYHDAKKIGYFQHYHPGLKYTDISHPHVFFGTPRG